MRSLQTPDRYDVWFDQDALEIGPKTLHQTGQIRVQGTHLRLWGGDRGLRAVSSADPDSPAPVGGRCGCPPKCTTTEIRPC
jgi:hypothetical protein